MFIRQYYDQKPELHFFYILLIYAGTYSYFLEKKIKRHFQKVKIHFYILRGINQEWVGAKQMNGI